LRTRDRRREFFFLRSCARGKENEARYHEVARRKQEDEKDISPERKQSTGGDCVAEKNENYTTKKRELRVKVIPRPERVT